MVTTFPPLKVYRDFFRCLRAAKSTVKSPIWAKFKLFPAFMIVLITCKNEEDPIKNEGTRVLTRLYVDFSDTQGQLTPKSVVKSG